MILIGLSDIHGHTNSIEKMSTVLSLADIVFAVGDITNFGGADAARQVITKIRQYAGTVLAVSGNCDYRAVDDYLDRESINLHAEGRMINGAGLVGLGGSLVTPFQTPNEYTESELAAFLSAGHAALPPDLPFVLISHQPPINTKCDRIRNGRHVGSLAVRKFIEKYRPVICFTGHIHESPGIDAIGPTRIVNPGQLAAGQYAYAEITPLGATVEIRAVA